MRFCKRYKISIKHYCCCCCCYYYYYIMSGNIPKKKILDQTTELSHSLTLIMIIVICLLNKLGGVKIILYENNSCTTKCTTFPNLPSYLIHTYPIYIGTSKHKTPGMSTFRGFEYNDIPVYCQILQKDMPAGQATPPSPPPPS